MGSDWQQDIVDFHLAIGHHTEKKPTIPPADVKLLRCRLVQEEMQETLNAILCGDLVAVADGIVDSIVVLLGTAVSYGIVVQPIWDEVHSANMTKVSGPTDPGGKQLKPAGWQPPRIAELLEVQGVEADRFERVEGRT